MLTDANDDEGDEKNDHKDGKRHGDSNDDITVIVRDLGTNDEFVMGRRRGLRVVFEALASRFSLRNGCL